MKEEKIDYNLLTAAAQSGALTLTNSGAIQLGTILAPGTNETFSIVIPLSSQLAALGKNTGLEQEQTTIKIDPDVPAEKIEVAPKEQPKTNNSNRIKADKSKGCPYPNCSRYGRAFSRAHDLKRHIARHQQRENKTSSNQSLQDIQIPIFTCSDCGSQFYSEILLEKHKVLHETGNFTSTDTNKSPLTCNICKKFFENELQLNSHLTTHIKSEPGTVLTFQPQVSTPPPLAPISTQSNASVSTTAEDDFRLEDMLLIRKPLVQPVVDKQTTNANTTANGKIRCEYCSKIFKTKWTLSSHVAAHEGRFQYQCCICTKKFVRKSHYESHVRSHDAARPFICEHCGKTFKESKHRREHLKRKHPANRNAIQSLLDSITACVTDEGATAAGTAADQTKLTILMPMNFTT